MRLHPVFAKALLGALSIAACSAQNAIGVLTSSIDSVQTTISITSGAAFWTPGATITVESEAMTVCAATLNSVKVCSGGRGANNSTAASHVAGTSVFPDPSASQALPGTIIVSAAPVSCDASTPVTFTGIGATTVIPAIPGHRINVCDFVATLTGPTSATLLTSGTVLAGPFPVVSVFDRDFQGRLRTGVGESFRVSIGGGGSVTGGGVVSYFLTDY